MVFSALIYIKSGFQWFFNGFNGKKLNHFRGNEACGFCPALQLTAKLFGFEYFALVKRFH
jgi:hypothetical protein